MSVKNSETRYWVKNKICELKDKIICFNWRTLEEIYLADVRGGGAGKCGDRLSSSS